VIFRKTKIRGVIVIDLEKLEDERGFFARTFCQREFLARGLNPRVVQCNTSFNKHKGTLRGLHFQAAPYQEAKLVRCIQGAIYDVVVDLRPDSPSYKMYDSFELTAENRTMLYVPEGVAHGFQTLRPDSEVFYQMSESYVQQAARGVRWDDPAFGISWPPGERMINERDRNYADFTG